MNIFGITFSEQKDLGSTAKDLDFLTQIWNVKVEWTAAWDSWKNAPFAELDVEKIEATVGAYTKKVGKLGTSPVTVLLPFFLFYSLHFFQVET